MIAIDVPDTEVIECSPSSCYVVAFQVAKRWRFANTLAALQRHGQPQVLPNAQISDLGKTLTSKSYQVFLKEGELYAFKGLSGRLGPIGVHVALLLCLFGTAYSGFGGWKGSAMCPEGQEFVVGQAISPASMVATPPKGAETVLQVGHGSVVSWHQILSRRDIAWPCCVASLVVWKSECW